MVGRHILTSVCGAHIFAVPIIISGSLVYGGYLFLGCIGT